MARQRKGSRQGRKRPPNENYVGRTAVKRILKCDRRTVTNLEEKGELIPALVDADGSRWYAIKDVVAFAVIWNEKRLKKAEKKEKATRAAKASVAPVSPDYNPDPMRRGAAKTSSTMDGVRAGPPAPASAAPPAAETLYDAAPHAVPSARSYDPPATPQAIAPKKVVESNWFSDEFKPDDGPVPQPTAPKSRRLPTPIKKTIAFIDPRWFSDDYQPPPSER